MGTEIALRFVYIFRRIVIWYTIQRKFCIACIGIDIFVTNRIFEQYFVRNDFIARRLSYVQFLYVHTTNPSSTCDWIVQNVRSVGTWMEVSRSPPPSPPPLPPHRKGKKFTKSWFQFFRLCLKNVSTCWRLLHKRRAYYAQYVCQVK